MKINGVTIPTPSSMEVAIMDIDSDSYRNANGKLLRDRVAVKRKVTCSWNWLSVTDASTLLKAVADEFFEMTYLDPMEGEEVTKEFYVGDRTNPVYSLHNGIKGWKGIKMAFTQR